MGRIEYRITGRFRKEEKRHVVDKNLKTYGNAKKRLQEIYDQNEWEMKNKTRKSTECGMISIGYEYYDDYDLFDLRIEQRVVSSWEVTDYAEEVEKNDQSR